MKRFVWIGVLLMVLGVIVMVYVHAHSQEEPFSFAIVADMRNYTGAGAYNTDQYFRGAAQAIANQGEMAFVLSPGDIDPPPSTYWTITQTLGLDARWYPGVGNHELPGAGNEPASGANMDWLRAFDYGSVNPGPAGCPTTTFSWDYSNAHFVMLNEYCDLAGDTVTQGDIPDHLYNWLENDLNSSTKPVKFVIGHEPAYPQPDADNGRLRHADDSLNQYPAHRDRFWELLRAEGVTAYLCGHTHNYSLARIDGVWQLDTGHARGLGDPGAPSTVVFVHVKSDTVTLDVFRDNSQGGAYQLKHRGVLVPKAVVNLPVIMMSER